MKRYLLLLMLFCSLAYAQGQDGRLDSSFAGQGWTAFNFLKLGNDNWEFGKAVLVQSDGKTIVLVDVGRAVLARYHADGRPDSSFGSEGFSNRADLSAEAAALQSDGKIVVVGGSFNPVTGNQDFALVRYHSDGTPDNSFGGDGRAYVDFGSDEGARSLALQGDGRMVAAGAIHDPNVGHYIMAVARLNSDGSPDNSFGGDGKATFDPGASIEYTVVALQSDGKVVVAGHMYNNSTLSNDFAFARLNSDGTPDSSFGGDGLVLVDYGSRDNFAYAVVVQSDGKVVAAGESWNDSTFSDDFAFARLNSDGTPDSSFGGDGFALVDFGFDEGARSLALQGDGRMVAAGSAYYYDTIDHDVFAVARLNPDGSPDSSFGGDGIAYGQIGDYPREYAYAVALQSNGKVVAAGSSEYYDFNTSRSYIDFALARYNPDGSPDSSFNGDGALVAYYPEPARSALADIARQSDGKLVAAGRVSYYDPNTGANERFGLVRYNSDGTLDNSFGSGGKVITDFEQDAWATAVALQGDGKVVVGGSIVNNAYYLDFALARYNPDGSLDTSFGGDGRVTIDFETYTDDAQAVAVQGDGKIVVAGLTEIYHETGGYNYDFALARLNPDGSLDTSFGGDGRVTIDFDWEHEYAYALVLQGDGKIVVAGETEIYHETGGYNYDFALARLNSNGSLDTSFGGDGLVTTDFFEQGIARNFDQVHSVALQSDGRIVVGGHTETYDANSGRWLADLALACYNPDGSPDTSFSGDGKLITTVGSFGDFVHSIALQSDGKIIAVGNTESYDPTANTYYVDFALVRYTSSGALDNTFDGDGVVTTDLGIGDYFNGSVWHSGKLYAAGGIDDGISTSAVVAVYHAAAVAPPPSGPPVVSIDDVTESESTGTATLTISLNKAGTQSITISYATQDSTATSKGRYADYRATKGVVTFAAGELQKTVSVAIRQNAQSEPDEYFKVNIVLGRRMETRATIGDATGVVTITEAPGLVLGQGIEKADVQGKLSARAYPNPSGSVFTLQLQGGSSTPVTVRVMDILGRVVETRAGVAANTTLQLGAGYRPGVYYAQVVQGSEVLTLRLVKQAP